ncbi:hypothetical protein ACTFIV_004060 [Dictyostelium citrinum]
MYNKTLTNQTLEELKEKEWKSFTIGNGINGENTTLFIKSNFTHDTYSIIISDLSLVWIKHSDSTTTLNDKNRFNPHLDSPIEKILSILRESINEKKPDTAYRLSINNSNNLVFTISNKISFYTFKWNFECELIEAIINSDSRKSHSDFIRDHLIMPLMFCCKNQHISNQLLTRKLDKIVNIVTTTTTSSSSSSSSSSTINNNNTSNNININNGGVATLSVSIGTGGRNLKNNSNNNKKGGLNNIFQNILSENQKVEDFSENDFNFFNDPIFLQYYNHLNPDKNINNNDNNNNHNYDNEIDLNSTVLEIDSNDLNNKNSTKNLFNNSSIGHTNSTRTTTTTTTTTSSLSNGTTNEPLSLFYDVELTPKKNYNLNNSNRNRTNNSTMTSLPSSISFIPYSQNTSSSLSSSSSSSFVFPQNIDNDENDENDSTNINIKSNISNNLKQQFEVLEKQNSQELLEEKKRKLELEEKLEQSKQKQLNKKKKTKFV